MALDLEAKQIYDILKRIARDKSLISYSALARHVGTNMANPVNRNWLYTQLGSISAHTVETGKPMLSAVVINEQTNIPGKGFFELADTLGLRLPNEDDLALHIRQLNEVYEEWDKKRYVN